VQLWNLSTVCHSNVHSNFPINRKPDWIDHRTDICTNNIVNTNGSSLCVSYRHTNIHADLCTNVHTNNDVAECLSGMAADRVDDRCADISTLCFADRCPSTRDSVDGRRRR
jgi:hypothetical protein